VQSYVIGRLKQIPLVKKYTHDLRGTRYLIKGKSRDGRICYVLCRFLETGRLGIITGYSEREQTL